MEQVVLPLPAMLLMLSPHFDMQMCGPLLSAMLQNEQYNELYNELYTYQRCCLGSAQTWTCRWSSTLRGRRR